MVDKEIESLNEKLFTDTSLEELENRLNLEIYDEGNRCWTCTCKSRGVTCGYH